MDKEIKTFEELEAYKSCRTFRRYVMRRILPSLIERKEFDLGNQLKRSSRSVTANIAEGYGRFHYLDNSRFCSISRGSIYESLEHIITAHDDELIEPEVYKEARSLFEAAIKPLNGYFNYLLRAADKSK